MQFPDSSRPEHLRWLVLLHQVPPEPLYLRAKILRRIKQLGAVPLKKSAYVLPSCPESLEDFQWLRKEILAGGGEAWILEARVLSGEGDQSVTELFQAQRAEDYSQLIADCRSLLAAFDSGQLEGESQDVRLGKLRKRLSEIVAIDYFAAAGRQEAEEMIDRIEKLLPQTADGSREARPKNTTWVTRPGVGVDRMASAWLIHRFIDTGARFRFSAEIPLAGELRFDTFEGEFTHEGELCTFEVLVRRFALDRVGLAAIAEIVHDLDFKEEKFARAETAGVAAAIAGIQKRFEDDALRIQQAELYFDWLFAQFDA